MKLSELIHSLEAQRIGGPAEQLIEGLYYDSREVRPGGLFFALRGLQADGHRFIDAAVAAGAVAVVMEEPRPLPVGVTGVLVDDGRRAMGEAARVFFGDPTGGMTVVGVTGTNGKTTVTYLVEALLKEAGYRPAVIGTVAYRFEDRQLPAPHTTPESVDLLRHLREFRDRGCNALVMEVSSHALDQKRVVGVAFDLAVFTNLTPEHLDYHHDMETYFAAKRLLFDRSENGAERAVINVDDPFGARLAEEREDAVTCSCDGEARVKVRHSELSLDGIRAVLQTPAGELSLRSSLLGRFNLQNLLSAAGAGIALGLPLPMIATGLQRAKRVPGRLDPVPNALGAQILVDYAHTPDALEKALAALRGLQPRRLVAVFGCGGDRDRTKRPVMGEVTAGLADLAVLTSDNPRTEDPLAIIEEIRPGLSRVFPTEWSREQALEGAGRGYLVIPDRREALNFAVSVLGPGDVLLAAGKGHEDYQIIGREKIHFDDREELARAVARRERAA